MSKKKLSAMELKLKKVVVLANDKFATKQALATEAMQFIENSNPMSLHAE